MKRSRYRVAGGPLPVWTTNREQAERIARGFGVGAVVLRGDVPVYRVTHVVGRRLDQPRSKRRGLDQVEMQLPATGEHDGQDHAVE